ncbi:DEKNAAC105364 [Brettanomyces naardenensis]|uniref:DEKNAAC105364 n=1 Tax=Brettanomyces naardenensis TaxID=13370 RepID=A0A448YTG4_BRENA|nr:DEKNAAC105364 [Brettanomyces naardenensis]
MSTADDWNDTNDDSTVQTTTIPAITGQIIYVDPMFRMPGFLAAYKVPILSYSASLVSTAIGFPLDSIKTRMQTHNFRSALECFQFTVKYEGFAGLFRGIVAPLVSTSFSRSLGVSIFAASKPIVSSLMAPVWGKEPLVSVSKSSNHQLAAVINNIPVSFVSGCLAGAVVSTFACPFELTKIFQQIIMLVNSDTRTNMKSERLPTRLFDVFRSILDHEGFKGLYSGYRYHLLRDSCSSGLFYGIYETVKLGLQSLSTNAVHKGIMDGSLGDKINLICVPVAGAMAGCLSWVTVFPIDTVKSKYQRDVVGNIVRARSGLPKLPVVAKPLRFPTRDMYKGLGPSITRSILTTAIFFSLFEGLMKNIA